MLNPRYIRLSFVIGSLLSATLIAQEPIPIAPTRAVADSSSPSESTLGRPMPLTNDEILARSLQTLLAKYRLPALGAAIVDSSGVKTLAVVGVRKKGDSTPALVTDLWHLGSDTKAITATLIARLVEEGKLTWQTTLGEIFPDARLDAVKAAITLQQLITHRAGLPHDTQWREPSAFSSLTQQRRATLAELAKTHLVSPPGEKFEYSNWGFVLAAAMAEETTHVPYGKLMEEKVFGPLRMFSVGYGWAGKAGGINQPWAHDKNGLPLQHDNALVMAPAGGVHCSLEDWGKFIADQLRGAEGKPALLQPESYTHLHDPLPGETYAGGWGIGTRSWAGGRVYSHTGSNTMNLAVVWMAPNRDVAFLVVCNQGDTVKACDEAVGALMARWHELAGTK